MMICCHVCSKERELGLQMVVFYNYALTGLFLFPWCYLIRYRKEKRKGRATLKINRIENI